MAIVAASAAALLTVDRVMFARAPVDTAVAYPTPAGDSSAN